MIGVLNGFETCYALRAQISSLRWSWVFFFALASCELQTDWSTGGLVQNLEALNSEWYGPYLIQHRRTSWISYIYIYIRSGSKLPHVSAWTLATVSTCHRASRAASDWIELLRPFGTSGPGHSKHPGWLSWLPVSVTHLGWAPYTDWLLFIGTSWGKACFIPFWHKFYYSCFLRTGPQLTALSC